MKVEIFVQKSQRPRMGHKTYGQTTASLRSCEYSKNNKLCMIKIHYKPIILYLNYINRKTFFSIKQDERYSDPKAHID